MSGYVVTINNGNDYRNLLMVNNTDPKSACDEANQWMGMHNAEALAPISDATIEYFEVVAGKPWLFTTAHSPTSKVTSSLFTDDGRRGGLR
jgi:hypothetical protein